MPLTPAAGGRAARSLNCFLDGAKSAAGLGARCCAALGTALGGLFVATLYTVPQRKRVWDPTRWPAGIPNAERVAGLKCKR